MKTPERWLAHNQDQHPEGEVSIPVTNSGDCEKPKEVLFACEAKDLKTGNEIANTNAAAANEQKQQSNWSPRLGKNQHQGNKGHVETYHATVRNKSREEPSGCPLHSCKIE